MYFGDTKNMPYGEKTKEELITFSKKIFDFFEKQGVKAVVMACNTTSANVYDILKNKYDFKIYPIIQSVTNIMAKLPVKKLGVFATHATINSHAYKRGINSTNKDIEVIEIACPDWVRIVEEKIENTPQSLTKIQTKTEEMLALKPEKIVLGCTHYPYLINQLKQFAPENIFINPAKAFAEFIKEDLSKNNLLADKTSKGLEKFYVSANPENFQKAGSMFYEINELPELISL